jgi:uracil-DNA glycosylase
MLKYLTVGIKRPREEASAPAAESHLIGISAPLSSSSTSSSSSSSSQSAAAAAAGGAGSSLPGAAAAAPAASSPSGEEAAARQTLLDLGLPEGHASTAFLLREVRKPYFSSLMGFVAAARAKGSVFPPRGKELAALSLFPQGLGNVKVVILGQDPYHGAGQANGLAFSVPKGVALPPSLRNIMKEVYDDCAPGAAQPAAVHGSLEGWARSGVLLLNTCLTVSSGAANSHADRGWEVFTDALIAEVSRQATKGAVFILWGKPAQQKKRLIAKDGRHLVLETVHPSPLSAHRGFFGTVRGLPFFASLCFLNLYTSLSPHQSLHKNNNYYLILQH